jgi:hypothetical protein
MGRTPLQGEAVKRFLGWLFIIMVVIPVGLQTASSPLALLLGVGFFAWLVGWRLNVFPGRFILLPLSTALLPATGQSFATVSPWMQLVLLLALGPVALVGLLRLVLGKVLFTHILGNLLYDLLKTAFFGAWRARRALLLLLVVVSGFLIVVSQLSSGQKSMQQNSRPLQQPTYQQPAIPQR